MLQSRFGLRRQQPEARRTKQTVRPKLEVLEDRTVPSVVAMASPPPVPSMAAVVSYVDVAMDQWMNVLAAVQQDISSAFQSLGQEFAQEVSSVQQQWDRILGISPPTPTPAPNTASQQGSVNGTSKGHGSGSGSGSGATPDQPIISGQGSTTPQPVTSGSGSGIATPEASGGGLATIYGQVWLDANGNGKLDNKELGFSGITVYLCTSTGQQIVGTKTDADGNYSFTNVSAGGPPPTNEYEIQVIIPTYDEATIPGYSQINAAGFSPVYTLFPGQALNVPAGRRCAMPSKQGIMEAATRSRFTRINKEIQ